MKLHQIRDVLAVHERGSIRAAARHIGIAQPAVSRSIRELEHDLGVTLFERCARGVALTPMGELFVRRAAAAHNELRQARDEINQRKGVTTGLVRVGLSTASHLALLPTALDRFRAQFPNVTLKIQEGLFPAVENALMEGALDFYAGPLAETPPPQAFLVERLFDNGRRVFCRKGHRLANARSLAELGDAEWISTTLTSQDRAELLPLFAALDLPQPRIVLHAASALSMVLAAAYSDLLVLLPEQWLDSPLTRDLLACVPVREALPGAPIYIVHRARLPLTPAAEFLSDMLRRSAANRPAFAEERA
ncbi:MAG: LysR family transcriptional regulator [Rhizobiales bacterium 62-17]|nr:LysR family transcriptional regulator [Hyphomicrobiales bacterium]OJY04253.1 MAG: LysR family transcriptional regulator [Rhizobiales bacterium 62-17]